MASPALSGYVGPRGHARVAPPRFRSPEAEAYNNEPLNPDHVEGLVARMLTYIDEQRAQIVELRAQRDTLMQVMGRLGVGKATTERKAMEPRVCVDCKASYTPVGPIQKRCKPCQMSERSRRVAVWTANQRQRAEDAIDREQDAKVKANEARRAAAKQAVIAVLLLCLWPALASAQIATPAPMVNPTKVEFACSPDHSLQDPAGGPIVTGYSLEVWAPGTDTVQGIPAMGTGEILKAVFVVTGPTCSLDLVKIPGWGNTFTIPKGPTYVMTITTRGPGGSARSPVSNFFTFPLPTPVPRPVSGVSVK